MPLRYCRGGASRPASVRAGIHRIAKDSTVVLIHDLARPAVTPAAIRAVVNAVRACNCPAGLAHPCADTVRSFASDPTIEPSHGQLVDRSTLWMMETPQAFPHKLLQQLHATAEDHHTDDLAAAEAAGLPVLIVPSLEPNPKITRPADLPVLHAILTQRSMPDTSASPFRIGFGYDIHRLEHGRKLTIGGVVIPFHSGLAGHSDADVLSHAIADAILGAAGLADIGHYFPNNDPAIAGINSLKILQRARFEAAQRGLSIVNVDATLIAEAPKIGPYISRMKQAVGAALHLAPEAIGIKATTNEGIGSLGAAEGIAAQAVALLSR
jgi:2-C-methyl-D-erythritol 2,4-cyclodiphosphate synthase/2-C-methyl-D-erythritol 4-phosphate cytidylyltransferase